MDFERVSKADYSSTDMMRTLNERKAIDGMIAQLLEKEADEIKHKDFSVKLMEASSAKAKDPGHESMT